MIWSFALLDFESWFNSKFQMQTLTLFTLFFFHSNNNNKKTLHLYLIKKIKWNKSECLASSQHANQSVLLLSAFLVEKCVVCVHTQIQMIYINMNFDDLLHEFEHVSTRHELQRERESEKKFMMLIWYMLCLHTKSKIRLNKSCETTTKTVNRYA